MTVENKEAGANNFGTRYLKDSADVFNHNAWDHVEMTSEQEQAAIDRINQQKELASDKEAPDSRVNWNDFYSKHENKFFKDRNWFGNEFPELLEAQVVVECGCGAGNSVYPIVQSNDKLSKVIALDVSDVAVDLVKSHPEYDASKITAVQYDLTSTESDIPMVDRDGNLQQAFEENSVDAILAVFVLSAVEPHALSRVMKKFHKWLKPGGMLLIRDYGRFDMAQLRFKPERLINKDNEVYIRGDNTLVHFFTLEEMESLATADDQFEIVQSGYDRRLIVNRLEKKKMHRVWVQCKFRRR
ncbi:hypothetical protein MP638_004212 [Amoeboaphelidium occidentale]|nr:hypothetical protein MP638_004212 [Amoeboaphelidium occidentale]